MIQIWSGLVVDECTDSSPGANVDIIAMDGRKRGEMITWIVNVYNQMNTQPGERLARKSNWQRVIRQGRTVLAADLNPHST